MENWGIEKSGHITWKLYIRLHVPIFDTYLFSTASKYFQFIIEKLMSSKISAANANKFFYHKQAIKI